MKKLNDEFKANAVRLVREEEIKKIRRENRILRQEREILKKAMGSRRTKAYSRNREDFL